MTFSLRILTESTHRTTNEGLPRHLKEFAIIEDGKQVGNIDSEYLPHDRHIHIGGVMLTDEEELEVEGSTVVVNSLGPRKVRELLKLLKEEFPEARTIGGMRVSGARRGFSAPDAVTEMRI